MKYILTILIFISANTCGQSKRPHNGQFLSDKNEFAISSDRTEFLFIIRPYGKITPVCYMKMDSTLVVKDSAATIKSLIYSELQNSRSMRSLATENDSLRTVIKMLRQALKDKAVYFVNN